MDGGAARDQQSDPAAESLPHLGKNQGIIESISVGAVGLDRVQFLAEGLVDQELGDTGGLCEFRLHCFSDAIEDPGD